MKLWILRPIDATVSIVINDLKVKQWTWDCAYGFVVRAETESEARTFAGKEAGDEEATPWLDPKLTSCEVLTFEGEAGVVLRDFLAG